MISKVIGLKPVTHKKTGNKYLVAVHPAIECTNGREEKEYVVYFNLKGQMFVREAQEFNNKFEYDTTE